MRKFKCSICGYIYDEATGMTEEGIAPGTNWEDIPPTFVCPLCRAPKAAFEELKESKKVEPVQAPVDYEAFDDLRELTAGELSAVCSNLAKGCEKQQLIQEQGLFNQLSEYYKGKVSQQNGQGFGEVAKRLGIDLSEGYSKANQISLAKADRGALRSLVWGEKVSMMLKSLLEKYATEGDEMLKNTKIFVCDICGFVYIGNELPEICPVCKVPNFKITQIGRR